MIPAVVAVCAVVGAAVAVFAVGRTDGSDDPCNSQPLDQPAVIAYLDPTLPSSSVCDVARSAKREVGDRDLPFAVSADDVNRAVILTATKGKPSRLTKEAVAARDLLRAMKPVLGVEATGSKASPPFCGTVPKDSMTSSSSAVAHALVRLHLGEQDVSYYAQSIDRRVTRDVIEAQRRVDDAFLGQLAATRLDGRAAAAAQRLITDRTQYDKDLEAGASALRSGNQADFAVVVPLFSQQRDVTGRDLDVLRSALGFPPNTCTFLAP